MNRISICHWESIEKDLGIGANRAATYTAVILKIQQVRLSEIRNLVDELSNMYLIKEPGQDVETFGSQVIEKTHCILDLIHIQ